MRKVTVPAALAWLSLAAVVVLTLGPASLRPPTPVAHNIEHFLAYAAIGALFAYAYPLWRAKMIAPGVALVAALEFLQLFAPGRHARWIDLAVDIAGLCAGIAAVALVGRLAHARRRPRT